ncbi:MAG: ParB/RepB/Spo0J family partition protein [Candidatus Bathyarchaeia archaeon]
MPDQVSEIRSDIPTRLIDSNEDNPRLIFSEEGMSRLTQSIREVGILVPLTVYQRGSRYVILDGERRWRAAKSINLQKVPCYVLPEPADRVEYILNMFKIHNVREEWSLLPTAQKLAQVIEQVEKKTNEKITNRKLATLTGLPITTVIRCLKLLTVPPKYLDMLFKEEKLSEIGVKPTRTTLTEDFFLEMLGALSAIKTDSIAVKIYKRYGEEKVYDCLIQKFKDGNIPDITDFRYLTKIIKQHKIPPERRERILTRVLSESDYRIDEAYDNYARALYESKSLAKQLDRIEVIIGEIDVESLDRGDSIVFLNSLQNFRKILETKIAILQAKLKEMNSKTSD